MLESVIERLGLEIRAEFVPFSQSRNAKESHRSLNWRVTLVKRWQNANGDNRYSEILTTDYSAGIGHCPAYKQGMRMTLDNAALIKFETEKGFPATLPANPFNPEKEVRRKADSSPILPNPVDVIHSLAMDSDVLDHATFESWAGDFGYDTDSRSAESTYRACLEIALKLRAGIGESDLAALREAASEY